MTEEGAVGYGGVPACLLAVVCRVVKLRGRPRREGHEAQANSENAGLSIAGVCV